MIETRTKLWTADENVRSLLDVVAARKARPAALREGVRGGSLAHGSEKALVGMGSHEVEGKNCQGGEDACDGSR